MSLAQMHMAIGPVVTATSPTEVSVKSRYPVVPSEGDTKGPKIKCLRRVVRR